YGWSLSVPYIERLNKTGSQDLYGSNVVFTSSLDGELVGSTTPTVSSTSTNPSVETNSYVSTSYQQCPAASSVTFSKSVSASSTLLMVHVMSSYVTGVTYAGVSMTMATSTGGGAVFYLVNPTSGTNNVVVSLSQAAGSLGTAVSYTGTDTSN